MTNATIAVENLIDQLCAEIAGANWKGAKAALADAEAAYVSTPFAFAKEGDFKPQTVANLERARGIVDGMRRPIEQKLFAAIAGAEIQSFWQSPDGDLRTIAPSHWNIPDFEAGLDWQNIRIGRKAFPVLLLNSEVIGFRKGCRSGSGWNSVWRALR